MFKKYKEDIQLEEDEYIETDEDNIEGTDEYEDTEEDAEGTDEEYEEDDEDNAEGIGSKKKLILIIIIIALLIVGLLGFMKFKKSDTPTGNTNTTPQLTEEQIKEKIEEDINNRAEELAEVATDYTEEEIKETLSEEMTEEQKEVVQEVTGDIAAVGAYDHTDEETGRIFYEDTDGQMQSVKPSETYKSNMTDEEIQSEYDALMSALTDGETLIFTDEELTDMGVKEEDIEITEEFIEEIESMNPNDLVIDTADIADTSTPDIQDNTSQTSTSENSTVLDSILSGDYEAEREANETFIDPETLKVTTEYSPNGRRTGTIGFDGEEKSGASEQLIEDQYDLYY